MNKKIKYLNNKIVKKTLIVSMAFFLISTVLIPSLNSESVVKKDSNEISQKFFSKNIIYDFLNNLIELFPSLRNMTFIQNLLDLFNTPSDVDPGIKIEKNADQTSVNVGETIIYSYKVINEGNVNLSDITVNDDKLGEVVLNNTFLNPGDYAVGELSYTTSLDDLPGPIINLVKVNASYSECEESGFVEDTDEESVTIEYNGPQIDLIKMSDVESVTVGDTIIYTYKVKNTGFTELYDITVEDDLLGIVEINETLLLPGQWAIGELSYTVSADDCGTIIVNTAVANGSYCDSVSSGTVEDSDEVSVEVICGMPDISIEKTADKKTATIGDVITYSYYVYNTGDIDLFDIYVDDDKLENVILNTTSLAPGEYAYGELTYTIDCEDCDNTIINTAVANGSYCDYIGSGFVEDSDTESVDVVCGEANISLIKKASTNSLTVGETITYYYFVYNSGDVNLYDVSVVDDPLGSVSLNTTELAPGEFAYGELEYTVKESDFPNPIENKAVAEGYTINQQKVRDFAILILNFLIPCQEDVWVDNTWQNQGDVNDYNSNLNWQVDAFNNFEDAIDVVCECGTVHVRPGYYPEQILIDKSLNLIAEGEVHIIKSNPDGFTIDDNTEIVKPIIFAFGGKLTGNNVQTTKKISVKIEGFHIDGSDSTIAILYHNVESGCTPALITKNIIKESQIGIQIQGCSNDTTITWNEIKYPIHTGGKIGILIENINDCEPKDVEIHHNRIGIECGNNIGVWNKVSNIVDAEMNWWGTDDGPQSPDDYDNYDAITDRIADGFGDEVRGKVHFDPWAGVESSGTVTEIYYQYNVPHYYLKFDASDSFGYSLDGTPLDLEYWWDFGNNHFSHSKIITRRYDEPGTYDVKLKISAIDQDLDPNGKLTDTSYYEVTQRPE